LERKKNSALFVDWKIRVSNVKDRQQKGREKKKGFLWGRLRAAEGKTGGKTMKNSADCIREA